MRFTLPAFILFFALTSFSQIPPGYYDHADGREGIGLRQALYEIIRDHNPVSYSALWTHFKDTDKKPNGQVWDMYSDIPGGNPAYTYSFFDDQCGNYSQEGDCYNREHSWPESWYSHLGLPMRTDLFHVYPTDGFVNAKRANYPFGEVGTVTWESTNGGKLGISNYPGWSGFTVFEPIDEYKGDFARTYFYMSTRYFGEDSGWAENEMVVGANIKDKPMEMLLKWHKQDPVCQKEIDRNNWVYNIQGNRNPFIDNPIFANAIWDPDYSSISVNNLADNIQVYPNPATNSITIQNVYYNDIISIEIIKTTGCVVKKSEKPYSYSTTKCIESLKNGVYFIRFSTKNYKTISKRLVVIN